MNRSPLLVVLTVFGCFALGLAWGSPSAQADEAGGESAFAVVAPGNTAGNNVLFLIDPELRRVAVFEHNWGGALRLTGARNFEWDVQLTQFPAKGPNMTTPPVREVEDEVTKSPQPSKRKRR